MSLLEDLENLKRPPIRRTIQGVDCWFRQWDTAGAIAVYSSRDSWYAAAVHRSLCDESGALVYGPDELARVEALPGGFLARAATVAAEVNGLGEDDSKSPAGLPAPDVLLPSGDPDGAAAN